MMVRLSALRTGFLYPQEMMLDIYNMAKWRESYDQDDKTWKQYKDEMTWVLH
jgi:hypothetical protein